MTPRLVAALSVPLCLTGLALAGCSSSTGATAASPAAHGLAAARPAAASPRASARASSPAPATAPASANSPSLADTPVPAGNAATGIVPGQKVIMAGSGCKPGASVLIEATASHATGRDIGHGTAGSNGHFSVTVSVPYMGEAQADVIASCVNSAGNTQTVADLAVRYTTA